MESRRMIQCLDPFHWIMDLKTVSGITWNILYEVEFSTETAHLNSIYALSQRCQICLSSTCILSNANSLQSKKAAAFSISHLWKLCNIQGKIFLRKKWYYRILERKYRDTELYGKSKFHDLPPVHRWSNGLFNPPDRKFFLYGFSSFRAVDGKEKISSNSRGFRLNWEKQFFSGGRQHRGNYPSQSYNPRKNLKIPIGSSQWLSTDRKSRIWKIMKKKLSKQHNL